MGARTAPAWVIAALWLVGSLIPLQLHTSIGLDDIAARDFSSIWVAGRMVLSGNFADVYNIDALRAAGMDMLGVGTRFNYTYPPHALFIAAPIALLPLTSAFIVWNLLCAAFFYWAARPFMPKGLPTVVAILTPAALTNAAFGQYGMLAGGLWLLAFRGSGLAAAALTFKPHIGFLVAVRMLRDRRALAVAIGGTVALIVVSLVAFGPGAWAEFFRHATGFQAAAFADGSSDFWVLAGTTPMIGYGVWGWLPFALGGAVLLYRHFNVFTAATATFLISPYGFHYDMAVVCLGFGLLLFNHWSAMPALHRLLAALAFLTPALVTFGTWWVPPILLAGLWVQTHYNQGARDDAAPQPTKKPARG